MMYWLVLYNPIALRKFCYLATKILEDNSIKVEILNANERNKIQNMHAELIYNVATKSYRDYFSAVITNHKGLNVVILDCTEYPFVVDHDNSTFLFTGCD